MTQPSRLLTALGVGLMLAITAAPADAARRGGSFGSRGMRTFNVPRSTQTAPGSTAPIARTMTPRPQPGQQQAGRPAASAAAAQAQRGGFLRRWGGPLLGGLMLGGLVGMLMGHGLGAGMGGMMALLLQVGLIALVAMLVIGFIRRRQNPAMAGVGPQNGPMGGMVAQFQDYQRQQSQPRAEFAGMGAAAAPARDGDEIGLTDVDFDAFARILGEIQTAFGRGDHDTLRAYSTPEAVSYLAEELSRNAMEGRRNDVSQVKLLQGDLSEAWREDDADWATVAMRYSSLDVTRDAAGKVVDGDPDRPLETTELWTFTKRRGPWGESWKLAAIQDT